MKRHLTNGEMEGETPTKLKKESDFTVVAVVSEAERSVEVPLCAVRTLRVEDKRQFGQVLRKLPALPDCLSHLKRVNDSEVVIGSAVEPCPGGVAEMEGAEERQRLVPALKPQTRAQFEWAKQHWPCAFHPNKQLESVLSAEGLNEYLQPFLSVLMGRGRCVVIREGVPVVEATADEPPALLGHPALRAVQLLAKNASGRADEYLATGSDVILSEEPCAMCAMALVHARASRVFVARPTSNGVLLKEDRWQLHLEPSLNHHYHVFRVQLNEDHEEIRLRRCGEIE